MSPAQMSARLMQQFNLSADQMAKMQALMKEKSATMQSLNQQKQQLNKKFDALDTVRPSYKADIFNLAEEQSMLARRMMIEKGEMRFKLDSMLSPEQRQRFAQMRAKKSAMKQRMKMRKGMPRGMGMPQMGMPPKNMQGMSMPTMKAPAPVAPATSATIATPAKSE
jgi:cell division protein FtsB